MNVIAGRNTELALLVTLLQNTDYVHERGIRVVLVLVNPLGARGVEKLANLKGLVLLGASDGQALII